MSLSTYLFRSYWIGQINVKLELIKKQNTITNEQNCILTFLGITYFLSRVRPGFLLLVSTNISQFSEITTDKKTRKTQIITTQCSGNVC